MGIHSPTIVNCTKYTIVVFQERGILYNKQVLKPGEAVNISRRQTGGMLTPYYVHAVIGDEKALPTRRQSIRNLVSVSAIPAAFVAATLATAASAGVLAGPSAALAPLVSGMVVKGVVVDTAALAAGTVVASRAAVLTGMVLKKHPDKFMSKTGRLRPGERFLVVKGGLSDGKVEITSISKKDFNRLGVTTFKSPIDTLHDKIKYYVGAAGQQKEELTEVESRQPQECT